MRKIMSLWMTITTGSAANICKLVYSNSFVHADIDQKGLKRKINEVKGVNQLMSHRHTVLQSVFHPEIFAFPAALCSPKSNVQTLDAEKDLLYTYQPVLKVPSGFKNGPRAP